MKFYEKLVQLRKQNGYTQEQLAEQLGVSRQAVSRWEAGETTPEMSLLVKLCQIYGVSADYLINDEVQTERDIPAVKKTEQQAGKSFLFTAVGFTVALCCWIIALSVTEHEAARALLVFNVALSASVAAGFYVKYFKTGGGR